MAKPPGVLANKRPKTDTGEQPNKRLKILQNSISDNPVSDYGLVLNIENNGLPDDFLGNSLDASGLQQTVSSQSSTQNLWNGTSENIPIENGLGSTSAQNHQQLYQLLQSRPQGTVAASQNYAGAPTIQRIQRHSGPPLTFVRSSNPNNLAPPNVSLNDSVVPVSSAAHIHNVSDESIAIMNIKNNLANMTGNMGMNSNISLMQSRGGTLGSQGLVSLSSAVAGNSAGSLHQPTSVVSQQLNRQQQNAESLINGSHMSLGNPSSLSMIRGVNPNVSSAVPVSHSPHQNILGHPSMINQGATLKNSLPQMSVSSLPVSQNNGQQSAVGMTRTIAPPLGAGDGPEKQKMIQQRLVLLLHANKCQRRESMLNGKVPPCTLPHCHTMKRLLGHLGTCNAGKLCPEPHCSISRQIISHWKTCVRTDCPVCVPLKQQQQAAAAAFQSNQLSQGLAAADMKRVQAAPGLQFNTGNNGGNINPVLQSQTITVSSENLPAEVKVNVTLMNAPPNQVAPAAQEAVPENATSVSDWKQTVTPELRRHLVKKIVQAIFPTTNILTVQDTRMNNLIIYARKVEGDMYGAATSKEDYFKLIAEKIYKIKQELEEKRQKKKEMQLQQPQQAPNQPVTVALSQSYLPSTSISANDQRMVPPNITVQTIPRGSEHLSQPTSQVSLSLNSPASMAVNQSQFNQSQVRQNALSSVDLQQMQQLQHFSNITGPITTMANASIDTVSVPATVGNISVSQFNSTLQQSHPQMTDAFQNRQIAAMTNQQQQQLQHLPPQPQQSQAQLNLYMSNSQSGLSQQMTSHSTTFQLPQSFTAQQQSPQTSVQQLSWTGSVPGSHHQTPSTLQSQQNSQQNQIQLNAPQLQQQHMQVQSNTRSMQSSVLNFEDSNDWLKPLISLPQEGATSVNQADTNRSVTPVSSTSDHHQQQQKQLQHLQSQMQSYSAGFQIPQSTLQQQPQQTLGHQSPWGASLVGTQHSPVTPQSQQGSQQNQVQAFPPQLQQQALQVQSNMEPIQPSVRNIEDSNDTGKPIISSSQEGVASINQMDMHQPNTAVSKSLYSLKSESGLSPQIPNSTTLRIPQSATPQPQSQPSPIQLPPRAASVPATHLQTPATPQSQQNSEQNKVQPMQVQMNMKTVEPSVSNVEDGNEVFKPSVSSSQEVTSMNQVDTNQPNTPVSSTSDRGPAQSGGKVFPYGSQASVGESSYGEKMEVDADVKDVKDVKTTIGKSEFLMDSKRYPEINIRMEIKKEPVENGEHVTSSTKEELVTVKTEIKREQEIPTSSASSSEVKTSSNEPPKPPPKFRPNQKVFKPDELRHALMPTLENLYKQDPESLPFRQPVDPELLQIPDYFDIIKKPMDLSTIKRKLDTGQYQDPWQYVEDVRLVFENAWLYNKKTSRVYRHASKLAEVFDQEIDPVMRSLGYCCGQKYIFQPQDLCCYGRELCSIPRDSKYWSYQNRYTYCCECFSEVSGDEVSIVEDPAQPPTVIKKDQFVEMKNDLLEPEPFVECNECGRKFHQICALHFERIWPEGFSCSNCLKTKGKRKKDNRFTAKRLQQSRLGQYIEMRVNNFLKRKDSGAGEVTIRVVSSSQKSVEVKPGMKARSVDTGEWPSSFPYTAKALFAFEDIDGVDTCFFGMHVQEYGSDSPMPNTRRVYIAYLDSVHFFQPKQYRTAVYHEILLGYLEYVKKMGYVMAHIWACPPSEGDDFIFHCHPPEQKFPKPKRLQDWYKKMLDKGIMDRVVMDYKDIFKQAVDDGLKSAAELPYFEGDFWPNAVEDSIKELEQEEEEKKKAEATAAEEAARVAAATSDVAGENSMDGKKKDKKSTKSKNNQRKNNRKSNIPYTTDDLSNKIYATMEKHKEVFFVIRLHSVQAAACLPPINDPDPYISCDMMDGRDAFLTLCKEKHYEFSSLRRAKFSTIAMLYELHNQGQDRFVYTCNSCKKHVETRYHCTVCDDFDLCVNCYAKEGHTHKMEKLGFGLDDDSGASEQKPTNTREGGMEAVQRCIKNLVHACQCRDANCRLPSCQKMKRVLQHARFCKKKATGSCPICKQLIALCCCHAKYCQEAKCPIPCCLNIKKKLKEQKLQQQRQQAHILKRRIAAMQNRMSVPQTSSGNSNSSTQPSSSTQPRVSPHPLQPGIGMKPSIRPPVGALQAVQQIQATAARQTAPHMVTANLVNYGKGNPVVSAAPANTGLMASPQLVRTQMQKPVSQVMPGIPNRMPNIRNVAGWEGSGYTQNSQPLQRQQLASQIGVRQPTQIMGPGSMPNAIGNPPVGPPQAMPNPGPSASSSPRLTQAWQQLLQTLKSPSSPQQQQQVLAILKTNPELWATFLKQRAAKQQNQPQQMVSNERTMTAPSLQNPCYNQQQQQRMLGMQRQQQQPNQFPHPQPPMYPQRPQMQIAGHHQGFQGDSNQFQFQKQPQQILMQPEIRQMVSPTHPPVSPHQDILGHSQGLIPSPSQQQLRTFSQRVRSPPPYAANISQPMHSPQPIASPRTHPIPSPRQQPVPSPHYPAQTQSPHSSLSYGAAGLGAPDQMASGNDLMLSHLNNPVSPHIAGQLQSPLNQDPGLANKDAELNPVNQDEQLDKFIHNL